MEIYRQREYDLQNEIDNILGIDGTFQNYRDEVNRFIDNLLNETIEINTLRHSVKEKDKEIESLNNIINELEKLIEQYSQNDYYYKYNGKYLKSEIINDLKELKGGK